MKTLSFAAAISVLVLGASALAAPPVHPPVDNGCCCCDINKNRIDCDRSIPASECVCPQVICPAGAPTFTHGTPPKATPPPTPLPTYKECCCCNPNINKIVCSLRLVEDCICLAVMCPTDAKTIFVRPTGVPTVA
ncbi:hypothetical protein HDV62DRAFT_384972 [Trichoderma sp. SZMC 28011]